VLPRYQSTKGMHWKTYAGTKVEFDKAQEENMDELRLLLEKEEAPLKRA